MDHIWGISMRDYGKVHTSFWTSETTRGMSEDARSLAMYLLTSPHGTIAGVFRLPDGYVCEDIQWEGERVKKGFDELLAKGFANRCETTKWVWIAKHFEWNKPENPNQTKSAVKIALSIPNECAWKQDYIRDCAEILGIIVEPLPNPSETVTQPVTVTVTEAVSGTVTGVENLPAAKQPAQVNPDTELQAACKATWHAYLVAFHSRYGADPVRNKTVSSQVKQFVNRIGYTESPLVAAWYVSHEEPFYVKNMHGIGLLLKDAEKLRTEWVTGKKAAVQPFKTTGERRNENIDRAVDEFLNGSGGTGKVIEGEFNRA